MYWTAGSGREDGCFGSVTSTTWPLGPVPDEDAAVGQGGQGEGLRVLGVEGDGPGRIVLALAAEDLARVAGRREDRPLIRPGQVPDPRGVELARGLDRLREPGHAVVRDDHPLTLPLRERGRGLLPPRLQLRGRRVEDAERQGEGEADREGQEARGPPGGRRRRRMRERSWDHFQGMCVDAGGPAEGRA